MSLVSMKITEFTEQLASDAPAPGGGSVAALAGSLSSALAAMVARLTVGRKKYEANWAAMEAMRDEADRLSARLLELVDKDTDAYNLVTKAFKMPKGTEDEKSARSEAIQDATKQAALVPFDTLETTSKLLPLVKNALEKGNPNCITDAGVAAQLIRTAAMGAAYNVRINLFSIKDKEFSADLAEKTNTLLSGIKTEVSNFEEWVEKNLG